MYDDLTCVLYTRKQILTRVMQLGEDISRDYVGHDVVMVCVLKGAVMFFADLSRALTIPVAMDFMAISSYGMATKSSGVVRIIKDLDKDIVGKDVIVVEDIVDSGLTLAFLKDNLIARGARTLKVCALLNKPDRRKVDINVDYEGFLIPDEFVVGYGLDYAEKYRNLPDIGVLKPEIYTPTL